MNKNEMMISIVPGTTVPGTTSPHNYTSIFLVSAALLLTSCSVGSSSDEKLKLGAKYEIIKPMYLEGVYNSLNDRTLSIKTARAYIYAVKHARRSHMAFQVKVPAGTIITIASPAERVWHIPYLVDQYVVKLSPDLSRGLDVVLSLDRGLVGDLDGLSPQIFKRVHESYGVISGSDQAK